MNTLLVSSYQGYSALTAYRQGENWEIAGERRDCTFLYAGKERGCPLGLVVWGDICGRGEADEKKVVKLQCYSVIYFLTSSHRVFPVTAGCSKTRGSWVAST